MNSLLLAAMAALAAPQPTLSADQRAEIGCVAALAIIAAEQQQGRGAEWPALQERGARFAQVVGESVMTQSGWSKEQVREAILAAVAGHQKAATAGRARHELPRAEIETCVAMMDRLAPPPPPPELPQCAAMLALAYDDAHAREGPSNAAKDLKTLASVLDYRAREALRADGKSAVEVDRAMAEAREAVSAEARRRVADDVSAGLDYGACLDLARP